MAQAKHIVKSVHSVIGGWNCPSRITDTGQDYTYTYDSSAKQLKLVTNSDLTDPDYVLARNVTSVSFSYQTGTNYASQTCVSRVAIQAGPRSDSVRVVFGAIDSFPRTRIGISAAQ